MISDIEDYFSRGCGRCKRFDTGDCSTRRWQRGLAELRRICLASGLEETVKWGHPCYMHAGRNIAIIGAFRNDYRLTFFNAALLEDVEGVLEKRGPNTRHPDVIRFVDNDQSSTMAAVTGAYLREAMDYAERGIRPSREPDDLELPQELVAALDSDPELAEAFSTLTPGRQRSYVIHLNSAKKTETRVARIAKFRDHIIAGKGALER